MRTLAIFLALAISALGQSVTISAPVFSGAGLNDATSGGSFSLLPTNATYVVTISATGTPDHFTWAKNGGAASSPVSITGSLQSIADGVQVRFAATTGHTLADAWTISANARGSLSGVNTLSAGVGARIRTAEDKARDAISVKDFGAIGNYDFGAASGYDNCAAFTAASALGGDLYFPPGKYYSSCTVTQNLPSHYKGAGKGDDCATSQTCLIFAAATTGIVNALTARGSSVRDMWVTSKSTVAGTDHGIWVKDSWFALYNVAIEKFGGDGLHAKTDNVDHMHVSHSYFTQNKGNGWFCQSSDCNVMLIENSTAYTNGVNGFNLSAGANNVFNGLVTADNVAGDFYITGTSHIVDMPYCEHAGAFNVAGDNTWVKSQLAGGCTITNTGGPSNTIITGAGIFNGLWFQPDTWPAAPISPTTYAMRSGHFGNGVASMWDDTNSTTIWHYNPSTSTFTFDKAVTFGVPAVLTNQVFTQSGAGPGVTVYKADSTGGGAVNTLLRMDGNNGSGVEAPYGSIYTTIENNTAGAQDGNLHFGTATAGTVTDKFYISKTGFTRNVLTFAVASLPSCIGNEGARSQVNDASAPVALSAVVGGGAVHVPVYCNGTNWIVN